eukprot:4746624-Pleurochrysis_carterae.AAC.1
MRASCTAAASAIELPASFSQYETMRSTPREVDLLAFVKSVDARRSRIRPLAVRFGPALILNVNLLATPRLFLLLLYVAIALAVYMPLYLMG